MPVLYKLCSEVLAALISQGIPPQILDIILRKYKEYIIAHENVQFIYYNFVTILWSNKKLGIILFTIKTETFSIYM